MQRRRFLGTAGACLLAPTIKLQESIDRHRLIEPFCDTERDHGRFEMDLPFRVKGNAYATDGTACARIPTLGSDTDGVKRRLPPMLQAWEQFYQPDSKWRDVPKTNLQGRKDLFGECPECGKLGDCTHCEYGMVFDSDFADFEFCHHCGGSGDCHNPKCKICKGERWTNGLPLFQFVDDLVINGKLWNKVAAIPDVQFSISQDLSLKAGYSFRHEAGTRALLFRSSLAIEGAVMPFKTT